MKLSLQGWQGQEQGRWFVGVQHADSVKLVFLFLWSLFFPLSTSVKCFYQNWLLGHRGGRLQWRFLCSHYFLAILILDVL